MNNYLTILALLMLLISACNPSTSETGLEDIPVLEAYLYPSDTLKLKVKKLTPYGEAQHSDAISIEDLEVFASNGNLTIPLKYAGDGLFADSAKQIHLTDSVSYSIEFVYGDQTVYALTQIPTKPDGVHQSDTEVEAFEFGSGGPGNMPEPLEISWYNFDASYYLVVVQNIESNPVLINDNADSEKIREFRSEPGQIDEFRIMPMMFEYYGTHRIIIYHLNEDYASLYEEQNTNSLNLNRPSSNVVNGLGIFTGANADTVFVEVQ